MISPPKAICQQMALLFMTVLCAAPLCGAQPCTTTLWKTKLPSLVIACFHMLYHCCISASRYSLIAAHDSARLRHIGISPASGALFSQVLPTPSSFDADGLAAPHTSDRAITCPCAPKQKSPWHSPRASVRSAPEPCQGRGQRVMVQAFNAASTSSSIFLASPNSMRLLSL